MRETGSNVSHCIISREKNPTKNINQHMTRGEMSIGYCLILSWANRMAFSLLLNASHSSAKLTLKSFHTERGFVFGFSIKQRSWASSVKRKNHTNSKLIYCVASVQKWRVCQRRWSTDHWKFGMHNCSFLLFFYRKTEINALHHRITGLDL